MQKRILLFLLGILLLMVVVQTVSADSLVEVTYYYSASCGSCRYYTDEVIKPLETFHGYEGKIEVVWKEVGSNRTNYREMRDHNLSFPSVVVENKTRVPKDDLNFTNLMSIIDAYLADQEVVDTYDENIITVPFIGKINTSQLSLPVLTIVTASIDSFNPCAFFILIFLLNLLLYLKSRRRMLLVGGIFIFFSGFVYYIFMLAIFNSIYFGTEFINPTNEYIGIISIIAGTVALFLGILNIKDFFYFKKGVTLSISDSKRMELFKKMRDLVKTQYLPSALIGTIFLAITVNLYELLCSLALPLIFSNRLDQLIDGGFLSYAEASNYLLFYIVIYVIPLLIILLLFVYSLKRLKLTEFHGQQLKLLSGILIASFGVIFIVDYQILENFLTPIALFIMSIGLTFLIIVVQKKYKKGEE